VDKETALAVCGAALGIAGLLLVFIGFIIAKADNSYNTARAKRFVWMARTGLIPFLASLICCWFSIWAVQGANWSGDHLLALFKLALVITGIYAIIATLVTT
jgi:hypothetical protein